ncbi:hypothetical protein TNIN_292781 [Trichonephila inaurata madagascariensis]|uniref:Uncharacterized protein n=1 Tax=Trichonephila inaurata madagascariensis TaxID=2747483 RepID=A0A8X6Y9Q3_9ARAC|nr:hypothetical protein TNIN_292771 [Trichonephila inaurata madagascariensis]GFY68288.1 hypothetical protein TNIN_292781 [Trichonephila inaurata madagascariensis]
MDKELEINQTTKDIKPGRIRTRRSAGFYPSPHWLGLIPLRGYHGHGLTSNPEGSIISCCIEFAMVCGGWYAISYIVFDADCGSKPAKFVKLKTPLKLAHRNCDYSVFVEL